MIFQVNLTFHTFLQTKIIQRLQFKIYSRNQTIAKTANESIDYYCYIIGAVRINSWFSSISLAAEKGLFVIQKCKTHEK